MPEVHEDSAMILLIHLESVVSIPNVWFVQETDDSPFELAASFAGNNLYHFDVFLVGFVNDTSKFLGNCFSVAEDFVEIELELAHCGSVADRNPENI